jgi:hypothetical protein
LFSESVVAGIGGPIQAVEDAPKEPQHAPCVERRGRKATQKHQKVMAIGRLHHSRRIPGGSHGPFDDAGEPVERRGTRSWLNLQLSVPHPFRLFLRKGWETTNPAGVAPVATVCSSARKFVKANRRRLAEIHGRLARVGWDFDEGMAVGKILASKAMPFRSENQGNAASGREFWKESFRQIRQGNRRLLRLAMRSRTGTGHKRTIRNCFSKIARLLRVKKQFRRANRRSGFTPVRRVRSNHTEAREAEVGHGARHGTDVEGVAGRDENDVDAVALGLSEQELILERSASLNL